MPWVGTSRPRGILHGLKAPFKLLHRLVCLQELNKFQALSESFDHTVALGHAGWRCADNTVKQGHNSGLLVVFTALGSRSVGPHDTGCAPGQC